MACLGPEIECCLEHTALRHRVALLEDTCPAIVVRDASSIASPVPYVRLETGRAEYTGQRRRLQFEHRGARFTVRARLRDVPRSVADGARITYVTDERGRAQAVSAADATTRTLHLLVETDRAAVTAGPADVAAIAVAETLAGSGLDHLLAADGPVWIGDRVPELVRTLLTRRVRARRPRFEREIAFLRRAARGETLPGPLARRLKMLEAAAGGARSRPVDPAIAEKETKRLVRLVESRACGSLRLAADEIRGLINPRPLSAVLGHGALMFSLQPGPGPGGPRLQMWRAGEPQQGSARTMCLGYAAGVLVQLEDAQDAYGLVDTILNFVETNSVGWVALDSPSPRRSPPAALEHLF